MLCLLRCVAACCRHANIRLRPLMSTAGRRCSPADIVIAAHFTTIAGRREQLIRQRRCECLFFRRDPPAALLLHALSRQRAIRDRRSFDFHAAAECAAMPPSPPTLRNMRRAVSQSVARRQGLRRLPSGVLTFTRRRQVRTLVHFDRDADIQTSFTPYRRIAAS